MLEVVTHAGAIQHPTAPPSATVDFAEAETSSTISTRVFAN
jgi:hypothetical protein